MAFRLQVSVSIAFLHLHCAGLPVSLPSSVMHLGGRMSPSIPKAWIGVPHKSASTLPVQQLDILAERPCCEDDVSDHVGTDDYDPSLLSLSTAKRKHHSAASASFSSSISSSSSLSKIRSKTKKVLTTAAIDRNRDDRTVSFDAVWAGNVVNSTAATFSVPNPPISIQPHTLILGTHPSRNSLRKSEYYATHTNAFWWIAGDCLGFRRSIGISSSSGRPYSLCKFLRYGVDRVISYEEQLQVLCSKGFALWDICQSCTHRRPKSSLDKDIEDEVPNPVREFCDAHPSIQRIIIANGRGASQLFRKHFTSWLQSGELVIDTTSTASIDNRSRVAFPMLSCKRDSESRPAMETLTPASAINYNNHLDTHTAVVPTTKQSSSFPPPIRTITLVCAISVSPAVAGISYASKRDFWETHVYRPGLELLYRSQQQPSLPSAEVA